MARREQEYLKIVAWIQATQPQPFSTVDVHKATGTSLPQVRHVLETLALLGYVRKGAKGYKSRIWKRSSSWHSEVESYYEAYQRTLYGQRLALRRLHIRGANESSSGPPKERY